jgi:hypothetical protein
MTLPTLYVTPARIHNRPHKAIRPVDFPSRSAFGVAALLRARHAGAVMDGLDEEIMEAERLLGLTTRQFVRTRLVLLLSDLQQVRLVAFV